MIVIEKGLEQLAEQYQICDKTLTDEYSIKILLGDTYYEPLSQDRNIVYGSHPAPAELFSGKTKAKQNITLEPGKQIITCSKHKYKIPTDYIGLVQTKGTLARLFIQATCNDGQIEPGFHGYITLELVNLSPWTIDIPVGSEVAQIYLIKCASPATTPYHGRYSSAALLGPTIPIYK
ncbi:dCTP deaminase [Pseudomonas nitroreducens]|uniref:dCTP deaminase n=1 Tax=Pseudomonas nitroreducens TaxID=46680 RepID=UPI0026586771|nr:deoxycytidine deaminase [Pseudomonas nitroreducens]MCP1651522.1 deoxycytidine triphosphate deaminase [Pseudomonas nitroreducens]MCP1689252.1 deoxycytidine triphosphate deaminase [Pseudomonas nitroreducens]